jgi:hypothetical protein
LEPILVLNQCGSETALFSTQRVYVLSSLQLADLPEEARSKVLQAAAPGKPFVRRAGRLKIKIVDSMSIPVKWGTDSGEVGQRQSKATLAMAMISEVPHLSQEVRGS